MDLTLAERMALALYCMDESFLFLTDERVKKGEEHESTRSKMSPAEQQALIMRDAGIMRHKND